MAFPEGWKYRIKLTIDHTKVVANVSNFPVYLDLSILAAGFFTNVKSDGGDIVITKADGTRCSVEVVFITTGSSIGEVHFKAPSLSSTVDDVFYIWYGNSSASQPAANAAFGSQDVWSNSYAGVYHFQGDPTGSAPQCLDSTSNARNGTVAGTWTGSDYVQGKLAGKAYDFQPTTDQVQITGNMGAPSAGTIEYWINSDAIDTANASDDVSVADRFAVRQESVNLNGFYHNGTTWQNLTNSGNLVGAGWSHVAFKAQSGNQALFKNGSSVATATVSGGISFSGGNTRLGDHGNGGNPYNVDGRLDEVRISSVYRADGWITTSYNNQNSPSTFVIDGPQEPVRNTIFFATNF